MVSEGVALLDRLQTMYAICFGRVDVFLCKSVEVQLFLLIPCTSDQHIIA